MIIFDEQCSYFKGLCGSQQSLSGESGVNLASIPCLRKNSPSAPPEFGERDDCSDCASTTVSTLSSYWLLRGHPANFEAVWEVLPGPHEHTKMVTGVIIYNYGVPTIIATFHSVIISLRGAGHFSIRAGIEDQDCCTRFKPIRFLGGQLRHHYPSLINVELSLPATSQKRSLKHLIAMHKYFL